MIHFINKFGWLIVLLLGTILPSQFKGDNYLYFIGMGIGMSVIYALYQGSLNEEHKRT